MIMFQYDWYHLYSAGSRARDKRGARSSRPLDGGGGPSPEATTALDPPSFSFCRM